MTDAFLMASCPDCGDEVLLAHDIVEEELITCCVHCDLAIDRSMAREATTAELVSAGYHVEGYIDPNAARGCRDGQCGVRQPDR